MSEDDSPAADSLSRRQLLALAGVGVAGIAGCSEGDGADTDTPTDSPTPTAAETPTATATGTATVTATETPTPTRSIQEKMAHYGCPNLEKDGDYDVVVAQDGSGDYETVQEAIDAIPARDFGETRVFIRKGRYREKLEVPSNLTDVTFIGEDPEETVLTFDDHAGNPGEGGRVVHSTETWSFSTRAMDFTARDLTFENSANSSAQAIAVRVSGDRALFDNCRFIGDQDTLFTHERVSREYYRDCYIEGDVDFIFGASTAYFQDCEIFCKDQGYISASSTPEDVEYGHVFNDCQIHGDAGQNTVYLGRPWKPYARTVYLNCYLGDVIKPQGWDPWHEAKRPDKTETAFLAEYNNSGPGYTPDARVEWSHQLTEAEAQPYLDVETVFDGWNPEACL